MSTFLLTNVSQAATCYLKLPYQLVWSGYPLTKFTIQPFNDHDLTDNPVEAYCCKLFNKKLSQLQIFVDHAFGLLKGHFSHIDRMAGWNMMEMYQIIEALMIVYNILELGDDPTSITGLTTLPVWYRLSETAKEKQWEKSLQRKIGIVHIFNNSVFLCLCLTSAVQVLFPLTCRLIDRWLHTYLV